MVINNKQELLAALADDMFQGIDSDGATMVYTIFEVPDYDVIRYINIGINKAVEWCVAQPYLEITPIGFCKMALEQVELESEVEVLSFLWQAGFKFGYLNGIIDERNRQEGRDT